MNYNYKYFFYFLLLLGIMYFLNNLFYRPIIETFEEESNFNSSNCNLDKTTVSSIEKNTNNINTLREDITKLNIKELKTQIDSVDNLINSNTDSLKEIVDQSRERSNEDINMDVRSDGNVYDENGKPLYEEKK